MSINSIIFEAVFVVAFFVGTPLIIYWIKNKRKRQFKDSDYYLETANSFENTMYDKGNRGEYLTYSYLEKISGMRRYIFNCYIPKSDGTTTEIDVIMIHEKGIFVFESKNYSGWIFGNEQDKTWTVSLRSRHGTAKKYHFYNPVRQNKNHVKWLAKYLGIPQEKFYSFIIFGSEATLKNVLISSPYLNVLYNYNIPYYVGNMVNTLPSVLTGEEIDEIYHKLEIHSGKTAEEKQKHIDNIRYYTLYHRKPNADGFSQSKIPDTNKTAVDAKSFCDSAREVVGVDFLRQFNKELTELSKDEEISKQIEEINQYIQNLSFNNPNEAVDIFKEITNEYNKRLADNTNETLNKIKHDFLKDDYDDIDKNSELIIKLYLSLRAIHVKNENNNKTVS